MRSSEQSGGFLALLALATFVGGHMAVQLPEPKPECVTVQGYEYQGRDAEGRAAWEYPEWEKCR